MRKNLDDPPRPESEISLSPASILLQRFLNFPLSLSVFFMLSNLLRGMSFTLNSIYGTCSSFERAGYEITHLPAPDPVRPFLVYVGGPVPFLKDRFDGIFDVV